MQVTVLTHLVSPYQVELFNAIAELQQVDLFVVYLHRNSNDRLWATLPLKHQAICLDEEPQRMAEAQARLLAADLAVLNYYVEKNARKLLQKRAQSGKPWAFWGERPGFRQPLWVGRLARRWLLAALHKNSAPIWGIGDYAVNAYQQEFGLGRSYWNLPYFSDLSRFQESAKQNGHRQQLRETPRTILFSGSLIPRKGVDLLANAFGQLARDYPAARLQFLGAGEMREELERILAPVSAQVEFLGFQDWQDLPRYYAAADLLCAPSRYDGWGLVVPEGLAAGLPVISTDCTGAAREFIQSGKNGWLIPANNQLALNQALHEALSMNDTQLTQMSHLACQSVQDHTLQQGARRFVAAAQAAITNWS